MRYERYQYPGTQHGFNNDTTPRFDAAAAKLAWSGRSLISTSICVRRTAILVYGAAHGCRGRRGQVRRSRPACFVSGPFFRVHPRPFFRVLPCSSAAFILFPCHSCGLYSVSSASAAAFIPCSSVFVRGLFPCCSVFFRGLYPCFRVSVFFRGSCSFAAHFRISPQTTSGSFAVSCRRNGWSPGRSWDRNPNSRREPASS